MSNGITTASGEVLVRGEEEERGCLGVCVMLEYQREEDGDWRWGERPPGEPGEREAHVHTDPHWVMSVQGYLFDRERKANTIFVKLPWQWGVMEEQHFLLLQQIKNEIKLK